MTTRILVPLAEGFEEIETVTIVDVLRRAELDVTLAGVGKDEIVLGSRGMRLAPDLAWSDVKPAEFDVIVLPGGMGGTLRMIDEPSLLAALAASNAAGKLTAAICAAPLVLEAAGVIGDRAVTAHPSVHERLAERDVRAGERVVHSGNLLTSQGPGTALEFALAIVRELRGAPLAGELAAAMVA